MNMQLHQCDYHGCTKVKVSFLYGNLWLCPSCLDDVNVKLQKVPGCGELADKRPPATEYENDGTYTDENEH